MAGTFEMLLSDDDEDDDGPADVDRAGDIDERCWLCQIKGSMLGSIYWLHVNVVIKTVGDLRCLLFVQT
jgi:hypothetical protein